MMKSTLAFALCGITLLVALQVSAQMGKPTAPVIPEADGYVSIPNAAVPPDKKRTYRAIYDATRAAKDPTQLLPALNMAGSELNAFAATSVPAQETMRVDVRAAREAREVVVVDLERKRVRVVALVPAAVVRLVTQSVRRRDARTRSFPFE